MLQVLDLSNSKVLLAQPGRVLLGFQEDSEYWIEKPHPAANFFLDDESLSATADNKYWIWVPGFYAGQVSAELECQNSSSPIQFYFDVTPHPDKVGRDQFEQLILDIVDYDSSLIFGSEPAQYTLGGQKSKDSIWVAYARMKAYLPDYVKSLKIVCDRPIQKIQYARHRVPINKVRNIDTGTVVELATNRALISALRRNIDAVDALRIDNTSLSVPFSESTLDNPANRIILRQIKLVIRKIDWLMRLIIDFKEIVSDTRSSISPKTSRRISFLKLYRFYLLRLTRSHPLSLVSDGDPSVSGLNAIASHPAYSRAHTLGIKTIRKGISSISDKEFHYITPTWEVYECWCFCALAVSLERSFPSYNWSGSRQGPGCSRLLKGHNGEKSIKLYFQLDANSNKAIDARDYYSISKKRIPDLVVEIQNESSVSYLCLDAKYRVGTDALLDAMSSAHIYHDSIRRADQVTEYSLILSPSVANAGIMSSMKYISKHRVGIIQLINDKDADAFVDHFVVPVVLNNPQ